MPDRAFEPMPLARHVEPRVREALADTRIVALVGPRQSGKTTLARKIAAELGLHFITLDDEQARQFANDDPSGFVRDLDRAVIDEIQRAPGLILALKRSVDDTPQPGRFLVTGSVDLFRSTVSPDSLAGRVETVELLPFSQAEMEGRRVPSFLQRAFTGDFPVRENVGRTPQLIERIVAGGYPEAVARANPARRRAWLLAYARSLAERDVADIADVTKTLALSRLIDHAAVAAGQTVNLSALAALLGVDAKTVDRWLRLLEQMFVLRRVPAWHRSELKRLVRTPKLHFLDSGLLAALRRANPPDLAADRSRLGSMLEGFVFSELSKLLSQSTDPVSISHYRDRDQIEVDFVLEQSGMVVGIEVKAAATVYPRDLRGLERLKDAVRGPMACGILLHDGDQIARVGDGLFAMPVSCLWDG